MDDYAGMTVEEILRLKRAAILRAPLPKGSPSWDDILHLTGRKSSIGSSVK
jgi:hypothetical protein